ncbi:hypothetical protein OG884_27055 [Streptosporangium sp. NBC_01755]|uniref:hypothetical protein n=1 Tax=unclassified Streptosporangium TaxID=2632669 RepID=UPI002DDC66BE|nr:MULTISPECIES: hypothetical protein [unclassified Streptosporangium]WSA23359.1 hypothetical protein OIE13_20555 [Streptosporangium sp. NBC_01810]WSC98504.1 hypothetical protein OG884_27055 [Streptosporangium sp. NBC_01755]
MPSATSGVGRRPTAYTGVLGAKLAGAGDVPMEDAVKPGKETPDDVAGTQQLRVLQRVLPAVTGSLVALISLHGER